MIRYDDWNHPRLKVIVNQHGHSVFSFRGLSLTGREEIERLVDGRYRICSQARSCFLSTKADGYDQNQRLIGNRRYKVALMPGREIENDSDRTTEALRRRGMENYSYGQPLAGLIPRLREVLSDKKMKELNIRYATALHRPIVDSRGRSSVLRVDCYMSGQWVSAECGESEYLWSGEGAFVFPVVA